MEGSGRGLGCDCVSYEVVCSDGGAADTTEGSEEDRAQEEEAV
jgi:hypothetical protein